MKILLAALAIFCWSQVLPNPALTPGLADPKMTKEVLCNPGFSTKSVRPPDTYTRKLKRMMIKARKLPGKVKDYELDHLISLELGGDPENPLNLWPQPYLPKPGAHEKDELEDKLHKLVCSDKINLEQAQHEIVTDWWKAYIKYVDKFPLE